MKPELSVVATLYRSEPFLEEFYERVAAEARRLTDDYEVVLVNDGSPDDSLRLALRLIDRDPRVRVVDLSRNFGHHRAMMTGLAHAQGELVFLIDSDLEEEPELLGRFHALLRERGVDVVYGIQPRRKGGWFERLTGRFFYRLFDFLSDLELPADVLVARLMTRRYVDSLLEHDERELLIAGLWRATGYEQLPVEAVKHSKSETTYTLSRKLALFIRGITAYSAKPLIYIAVLGALILLLSGLYIAYLLVVFLFVGTPPAGFTSLLASLWFLGGLIIFTIGIIALYLSVIFVETKRRPYSIVRAVHERPLE